MKNEKKPETMPETMPEVRSEPESVLVAVEEHFEGLIRRYEASACEKKRRLIPKGDKQRNDEMYALIERGFGPTFAAAEPAAHDRFYLWLERRAGHSVAEDWNAGREVEVKAETFRLGAQKLSGKAAVDAAAARIRNRFNAPK